MTIRAKLFFSIATLILVTNLVIGFRVQSALADASGEELGFVAMRKFAQVLKLIRKDYVDEGKIDYEHLIEGALNGMLASLDRFSSFIPPDEFAKMREETEGEFGGIGVVISIKNDVLTVIAPMEGTPGMKAGIMANDQVIKIDNQDTADLSLDQCVNLIKGAPGTTVTLMIFRPETKETKTFTIERAVIELTTVKNSAVLEGGIGYVRITQFNEKTSPSLGAELKALRQKDIQGLILDLRNNPGGLLTSAIEVSSQFIPEGQLIVFTEGRRESLRQDFLSLSGEKFPDIPVVTLINESSASAAEIVAGCLQDYGRALIVGEKSFGKGSVQSIVELDDQSAVRLTTAKYYTPSKRVIHEHGIEPDFIVDITDDESHKLALQRSRAEGLEAPPESPEPPIEDRQLARAKEIIKGVVAMSAGNKLDYAKVIRTMEQKDQQPQPEKK